MFYVLCCVLLGALLSMLWLRASHKKFICPTLSWFLRGITVNAIWIGALFLTDNTYYVWFCCVMVIVNWLLDRYYLPDHELHEDFEVN